METAELLLEKTSSKEKREKIIAYKSKARNTALHFAAQKNHVEFVDFLLKIIDVDHPMLTVCWISIVFSTAHHPLQCSLSLIIDFRPRMMRHGMH